MVAVYKILDQQSWGIVVVENSIVSLNHSGNVSPTKAMTTGKKARRVRAADRASDLYCHRLKNLRNNNLQSISVVFERARAHGLRAAHTVCVLRAYFRTCATCHTVCVGIEFE